MAEQAAVVQLLLDMRAFVHGMLAGYSIYGAIDEPFDAEEASEIATLREFERRLDLIIPTVLK